MAYAVQIRRGTAAEHTTFTGIEGELTINTTDNTLVVHDGVTVGGHPVTSGSGGSSVDITKVSKSGDTMTGNLFMGGNIIPTVDSDGETGYDLGSPSYKWRDLYLSQGSLYIDGQKVIESSSGTIVVQADTNQSLTSKVSGTGVMTLESATTVNVASTLQMQAGFKITDSGGNAVVFGDKVDMDNNQMINLGAPTSAGHATTKGYVDQEIANLINGAPGALDTLNELANALGDDADYAATITTALATKATTAYVDSVAGGAGGGASVGVSDDAPVGPTSGDLWFDTTDGSLNVYYNDGSSSQWVGTSGATGATGGGGGGGGGGVTSYADITARDAATPSAGEMAWVISETALYVYDGNEWDRVYSGAQSSPVWTNPPIGIYNLETDGSNTIISTTAVDPEGFPVVYDYDTNPATPSQVTSIVNNNDGTFSMTPSTNPSHAGSFTLRVKATDGLQITSKNSEIALAFVPQPANNIGFFNFSNPVSYSGSGNVITNMAYGTPASETETIVPGEGGYLATGTAGLPVFKFMPTNRTKMDFSASMGSIAKTVMVIFSAESAKFNEHIMWGHELWDYLGIMSSNSVGSIDNGFATWQSPNIRVNGTLVYTRQTAYAALDDTGTKFNSITFSGYKFNDMMTYNTFPSPSGNSYTNEHEVLGFIMWDTILTESELEVAHTLLGSPDLTAPWAP